LDPLFIILCLLLVAAFLILISCREYILKGKKGKIVSPSQLDSIWLRQAKKFRNKNFKLLYVGRIRVEKGIYFLTNLIKNKRDISLTIVGAEKEPLII
jgi:glycosyltransferase involved in cell wall biosynthesis